MEQKKLAKKLHELTINVSSQSRTNMVTNTTFFTMDVGTAKKIINFTIENEPLDLTDATVMLAFDFVAEEKSKIIDSKDGSVVIEDAETGRCSVILPNHLYEYTGDVLVHVYVMFNDGRSLDCGVIVTRFEESWLDQELEEMTDFYVKRFEDLAREIETRVSEMREDIESLRMDADQTRAQIEANNIVTNEDFEKHTTDDALHVTREDRNRWDNDLEIHTSNDDIHVSKSDRERWDAGGAALDTGWLDLELADGVGAHQDGVPQYRRIGNVVHLRGAFTNVMESGVICSTLLIGFRPTEQAHVFTQTASRVEAVNGVFLVDWRIDVDGNIILVRNSNSEDFGDETWFPIHTSFIIHGEGAIARDGELMVDDAFDELGKHVEDEIAHVNEEERSRWEDGISDAVDHANEGAQHVTFLDNDAFSLNDEGTKYPPGISVMITTTASDFLTVTRDVGIVTTQNIDPNRITQTYATTQTRAAGRTSRTLVRHWRTDVATNNGWSEWPPVEGEVTFDAGWNVTTVPNRLYIDSDNHVNLLVRVGRPAPGTNAPQRLGILPVGFRPSQQFFGSGVTWASIELGSNSTFLVSVVPSGVIWLETQTRQHLAFNLRFPQAHQGL